jgi:purine-binding chemotaxis protein CheW
LGGSERQADSATGDVRIRSDARSGAEIADVLAMRAARYGAAPATAAQAMRDVLVWTIGDVRHATPIEEVWAVKRRVRTTAVPGAPAAHIGLFARHGVIHNLFDPAAALGRDGAEPGTRAGIVILRHDAPRIAIQVDASVGIVAVPARHWDGASGDIARQIADDDGPLTIVATEMLIERLTGRRARPSPAHERG